MTENKNLGLLPLTTLVIGTMIGSGIFSLPQNMAENAGVGAILITWVITLCGMFTLTRLFQWLSLNKRNINDGIYGYARHGFGEYLGFNAGWGYWMSVWVGNVGYLVLMFSALGSFNTFKFFENGNTFYALVSGLIFLWICHFLVLLGIKSAALLNSAITVMKLIPIGLFVICVILAFNINTFQLDFWGNPSLGSVSEQVKKTMLYTVWIFLGVECATVYANRAKNMKTVSQATLLGFLLTALLLVCVSILSFGVVPQTTLAKMKNPSMAAVMEIAIGPWGAGLVNLGLILSVGGALLAWMLISSEMLYLTARGKNHTSPRWFSKLNKNGTPVNALWLTNGLISLFLVLNYLNNAGYNILIQLASAMALIPYLLSAAYGLKIALFQKQKELSFLLITIIGTCYGVWLIYAEGLRFLLFSMGLYMIGLPFYLYARKQRKLNFFNSKVENALALIVVGFGLFTFYQLLAGKLSIFH